ncbi:MAG: hypothetical protein ABWZ52_01780 [Acidimicrobiales bacterium]
MTRVDRWLFAPEPAGRVRAMRAAIAALILLRLVTGPYPDLSGQPAALFRPVWILSWLEQMPSHTVLVGLVIAGGIGAVLAIIGWRERATFLVAWTSLLVLDGCWASRGKIQHNDLPLLLVAAVLALAPVGVKWTDERKGAAWGWPVRTSIVVVTGIYFLTGLQKVVASGPEWVLSDNLRNVMYAAALTGKAPTDEVSRFIADRPVVSQGVALLTITIELGALVALIWPRTRIAYVVAVTVLHIGVYLTHGLDYSMWVGTAAIVLIDWRPALLRLVSGRGRALAGRAPPSRTSGTPAAGSRSQP